MPSVPCCNPKCSASGQPNWKGLCGKCYRDASGLVKSGKVTWERLAEMNLCRLETAEAGSSFKAVFDSLQSVESEPDNSQ